VQSRSSHKACLETRLNPFHRANPFPKVTNPACRIPLRYFVLVVRDCSSWRPDAESVRTLNPDEDPRLAFPGQRTDTANTTVKRDTLGWAGSLVISTQCELDQSKDPHIREGNSPSLRRVASPSFGNVVAHYLARSGAGILTCFSFALVGRAVFFFTKIEPPPYTPTPPLTITANRTFSLKEPRRITKTRTAVPHDQR